MFEAFGGHLVAASVGYVQKFVISSGRPTHMVMKSVVVGKRDVTRVPMLRELSEVQDGLGWVQNA